MSHKAEDMACGNECAKPLNDALTRSRGGIARRLREWRPKLRQERHPTFGARYTLLERPDPSALPDENRRRDDRAGGGDAPRQLSDHAGSAASFFFKLLAGLPATRSPAGTSWSTTDPAPVIASSPISMGARKLEFEPMNTRLPIFVLCLRLPS